MAPPMKAPLVDEPTLTHKQFVPMARGPSFTIDVTEGPDAPKRLLVTPETPSRIYVGKSPSCEVQLTDRLVSRRHLAMELTEEGLRASDLDSTNGTTVDGLAVFDCVLIGGEHIRIGETEITINRVEDVQEHPLSTDVQFGRVIGASNVMRKLYPLCHRLAKSSVPVVIEGETGTGKEVLAESLHEEGPRAAGPFVVFDCTAVPPNLMEAALFGHEKGAFTGASEARKGVFEEANGGTLLIDEIGDLELPLQAKLLRALERSEVRRIGGSSYKKVSVRVLAATRRNLDDEVQAGRFRDDLFYRLAVARIELPPLRRRQGDIAVLAEHFWRQLADQGTAIPDDFIEKLVAYRWPGNVRELHNAVARRVALGDMAPIEAKRPKRASSGELAAQRPDLVETILSLDLPLPRARERLVEEFQRRYVERVLDKHDGNVGKAAAASGIARRYFQLLRARARKE